MNKIYKLLFLFIAFSFFIIDVNAIDYSTKKLINLDSEATVKTDTFLYDTISYVNDNNNVLNMIIIIVFIHKKSLNHLKELIS